MVFRIGYWFRALLQVGYLTGFQRGMPVEGPQNLTEIKSAAWSGAKITPPAHAFCNNGVITNTL